MKYLLSLAVPVLLFACNRTAPANANQTMDSVTIDGVYKGDFDGEDIHLIIHTAGETTLSGYNTHRGVRSDMIGDFAQEGEGWKVNLRESGDHPYVGRFVLHFDKNFREAKAEWTPQKGGAVSGKKFTLRRVVAKYPITHTPLVETVQFDSATSDLDFSEDGTLSWQFYSAATPTVREEMPLDTVQGLWKWENDSVMLVRWPTAKKPLPTVFRVYGHESGDGYGIDSVTAEGRRFTPFF
ncbi:hypothetical protein ACWKWU_06645 [Chitinophaga lutea]